MGLTVAVVRVKHVRRHEDARELDNVVHCSSEPSRQRPQADRRRLANDDPRGWRRTKREADGNDQTKCCLRQLRGSGHTNGSSYAETDEQNGVGQGTPEVDRTTAEVGREDPGDHDEDHLEGGGDEAEGECQVRSNAGLCGIHCQRLRRCYWWDDVKTYV